VYCNSIALKLTDLNLGRLRSSLQKGFETIADSSSDLCECSDEGEFDSHADFSELLVNHKAEDAQLCGTAVVELDGTLGKLGLGIKGVPSEVEGSVTEVTDEFISGSFDVLHDGKLEEANEGKHLEGSGSGDGIRAEKGGDTVGVGRECVSGHVNVSRKVDSVTGDNLSEEGKLTDTSVLDLDVTETVELLLVTVGNQTEGIEESKGSLGTELAIESHVGGDRGSDGTLGRGEGSGGGDDGGDDDRLHDVG
jgi:hypothetical protein